MDSTIYSEIFVLVEILLGYVLRDYLVGHIARTAAEVPSCPQVSSPELLLQVRKVGQQMVRCLPLQPLQQSADRHLRRNRHKQVHVVLGYVSLHDLHFVLPTNIPDQIAYSRRYLTTQRRSAVLGYPHQVQMDLEYGMRAASVFCHSTSLICGARAEAVA